MTNPMNAIANQVVRNSARATQNAGWLYFDGMYRDYPAFKRKFASFQANYHYSTPTRELVQQFGEMCLPEKIAARIKSAETWVRLDAWFKDKDAFITDLMQDIRSPAIKDEDDYYVMLQSHIEEACNAGLLGMLLIPANVEVMVQPLPTWEKKVWRETQGRWPAVDRTWALAELVDERLEYAINMVATSERQVLPKPIPLHRVQRLPYSDGPGG